MKSVALFIVALLFGLHAMSAATVAAAYAAPEPALTQTTEHCHQTMPQAQEVSASSTTSASAKPVICPHCTFSAGAGCCPIALVIDIKPIQHKPLQLALGQLPVLKLDGQVPGALLEPPRYA